MESVGWAGLHLLVRQEVMAGMSRKRTEEELVSKGFCPFCSKCMKQVDGFERYVLYGCERCAFLSVDASRDVNGGPCVEITLEEWQRFKSAYLVRISNAEQQASEELPELLEIVLRARVTNATQAIH
jgi:hypothetical protein